MLVRGSVGGTVDSSAIRRGPARCSSAASTKSPNLQSPQDGHPAVVGMQSRNSIISTLDR